MNLFLSKPLHYVSVLVIIFIAISAWTDQARIFDIFEVSFTRLEDKRRGSEKAYTLSIVGQLPEKAISVMQGQVQKADTDTNTSLLAEDEYQRSISPYLDDDFQTVRFDINLTYPDKKVKGLKELSGYFEYFVAKGVKETDLGIKEFKVGAKGKLDSSIEEMGKTDWSQSNLISLKLKMKYEELKSIKFYDEAGKEIDFNGWSGSWTDDTISRYFFYPNEFPKKGKIVVEHYIEPKKKKILFSFKNISLLGDPLK